MKKALIIGFWILIIGILIYTRFVNLGWGLPYPMHPDERNMANAIQSLSCRLLITDYRLLKDCFNPHFFAYGQFPLYLGRFIVFIMKFFDGDLKTPVGFGEAVISLRIISATASVLNVLILVKIILFALSHKLIINNEKLIKTTKNSKIIGYSLLLFIMLYSLFIFSPYAIQSSHLGTTESLLMLFYSLIIYCSLQILKQVQDDKNKLPVTNYLLLIAFFSGLAIATKISSVIFLAVPVLAIILHVCHSCESRNPDKLKELIRFRIKCGMTICILICSFTFCTLIFAFLFSPHNLINFNEFLGSMRYESDVALGRYAAFYTRQFVNTTPVIFQMTKIFPYALGWPQYILVILGFFLLPWKNSQQVARISGIQTARRLDGALIVGRALAGKKSVTESVENINIQLINFLRFAFLIYFLPNAFVFAKWTRFMAPIFPLMTIFAILFMRNVISSVARNLAERKLRFTRSLVVASFLLGMTVGAIIPGLAYLKIYQSPDIRFQASDWIYKNIPNNSYILSETANVVDIPIQGNNVIRQQFNNYQIVSFNFYDLDENPQLQEQLQEYLQKADYIFVPSRRIFANHTCINNTNVIPAKAGYNPPLGEIHLNRFPLKGTIARLRGNDRCLYLQNKYPKLNQYYDDLMSGALGFTKVAEFTSYPKICLFHVPCFMFPDEQAEETWSVFDHPTIRIFKKNSNQSPISNLQFPNYKYTKYLILNTKYLLLVADTPEKWTRGLMNVRNKQEINGKDGMIFFFPTKKRLTFWNKNTYSDLDVYWLDDDKVIGKSYLPSIEKTKNIITIDSPDEVNKVVEIIR